MLAIVFEVKMALSFRRIALFGAVLLVGGAVWPLIGLKTIGTTIETKDSRKFVERLDIAELKRSLAIQIVRTQLTVLTPNRLPPLAFNLAMQAGIAVADAYVLEIVQPDHLFDLLKPSGIQAIAEANASIWSWGAPNIRRVGQLLSAAEYRGQNFYVTIPVNAQPKDQFRFRLRLSQWTWKLAGVDLPEELRVKLARELEKHVVR